MVFEIDKLSIDLKKIGIDFNPSNEQTKCLEELYFFSIQEGFGTFSLKGSAGTGKTSVVKIYLEILRRTGVRLDLVAISAPTHKAKGVLEKLSGKLGKTIHSICSLAPNVNIEKLSLDNLQFDSKNEPSIPPKGILIIDECSMIGDVLYDILIDFCQQVECKIVFLGDFHQLKPVGQEQISKSFLNSLGFQLTQVQRQKGGNPLGPILYTIRENINSTLNFDFNTELNKEGEGIEFVDKNLFIDRLFEEFTSPNYNKDYVRALAFTNDRVQELNRVVREIKGYEQTINVGELLFLYDSVTTSQANIVLQNSSDYEVLKVEPTSIEVFNTSLEGFSLQIMDERKIKFWIFLLDPNTSPQKLIEIGDQIEEYRLQAIRNRKLWFLYFGLKDAFCSFVEIKSSDGRVIKNKSIDYGYALTIHKSQGSTFNTVFVDLKDIDKSRDLHLQNQLIYVGLSRCQQKAICLV